MPDIQALLLLSQAAEKLRTIKPPPDTYAETAPYRENTLKIIGGTEKVVKQVIDYALEIFQKMREVDDVSKKITLDIQAKIEQLLNSISAGRSSSEKVKQIRDLGHISRAVGSILKSESNSMAWGSQEEERNKEAMKQVTELGKTAQAIKLDEFVALAEAALKKIENKGGMAESDLKKMKDCFNGWAYGKDEEVEQRKREEERKYQEEERRNREEERKRQEEERRKREEERKRQEEEHRRREEERERQREERRKREEEKRQKEEEERKKRKAERKQKLEEESKKREEERKRQEEEERKKREEERRRQEKEERRKREAEERQAERLRQQLEEERLKAKEAKRLQKEKERLEEEACLQREREEKMRREETERKRKEEEQRKRREEEERRRRLDPENWTPSVYKRSNTESNDDVDQVDGSKSYHKGICCVISAPDGALNKNDVECLASDEVDDVIETLYDGERLASSVISINSIQGNMDFEVPIRVHVPHATSRDSGDEVVLKYSVDGSDEWMTQYPAQSTKKSVTSENVKLSCLELKSLGIVKVAVVVRPRGETIMVDRPGVSQYLAYNSKVKLFIPRNTYIKQTEIRATLKNVPLENYSSMLDYGSDEMKILSTSSLITLNCQKPTGKDIEVDLIRKPDESSANPSGRHFQLFRGKENVWKIATAEYKNKQNDVSVHLPSSRDMYNVIEFVMPEYTTPEMAIEAARHMYNLATKTVVSVLVKQKTGDPLSAVFQCVRRDWLDSVTSELTDKGFEYGGGISRGFCMQDGDQLHIRSSGNVQIENSSETEGIMVPFSSLIDKTRRRLRLTVVDRYKQKDLPCYNGSLLCSIIPRDPRRKPAERSTDTLTVEIQLQIPKEEKPRTQVFFIPVRFPYTLSILAKFLSAKLTNQNEVPWMNVLSKLDLPKVMTRIERRARSKCDLANERGLCETVIKDWMKSQPKSNDKAIPVLHALRSCGLSGLAVECEKLLDFFSEFLTDKVLRELCQKLISSPPDVGQQLVLTSSQIDECVKTGSNGNEDPNFLLLQEWRESDTAINEGVNALNYLKRALKID